MELIYTILITLFSLALLVTVHEFGHFWVARRCGVTVLRFSVGFGRPLLTWHDRHGTEYVIAMLPLGGYVKMLDERVEEVTPGAEDGAFNRKSVWARIAIVAAGPAANLILAVVAYWFVFIAGETGIAPIIGKVEADSVAAVAGLETGQEIVAIDGRATPTWQAVNFRLLDRIGDSGPLHFSVRYPDSDLVYQSTATLQNWLADSEQPNLVAGLGIQVMRPPIPVILDEIVADSPAAAAGLRSGDRVFAADGQLMPEWQQWVEYVRARPGTEMLLEYERDGVAAQALLIPARKQSDDGTTYGQVGVTVKVPEWPPEMVREFHYGPWSALVAATTRTGDLVIFTLNSIKKMLTGLISTKNLSGPITIAKVATASAESGLESFIAFLALLSVSLGVINLLPVPVLDGGHLLFYSLEALFGRPVPEKLQVVGYQVGLSIIMGVMVLALYNDITRL
ncbi:sigma E protease regulator RseP [Halieaceae bacterium IMCC14734]|uniref:Zinc metalloprotease n=1 Tax=Candidatus Litorirhabdus singularis TaxID=2518993 RepID=A0ABT3TIN8_9GAMM|nr:sigma E protease regulator RseP [Candidatus Litorirhabdus singularis]MCX2982146.1 sigma E protease regulator RseP [Candidatus Litorirhabdus singularis]